MEFCFKFLLTIFAGIFSLQASALTPAAKALVDFETKSNAVVERSNQLFKMPHLDIPLEFVGIGFAQRLDPLIRNSLTFEKNGQKFIRWILNPEDTKWGQVVIDHFAKEKGITLEKKYYYNGYQTASRSYIVEDPISGALFSAKSSTNKTGGFWSNKKQPVGEAIDSRIMSDFLHDQNIKSPFKYFVFMDEPAIIAIQNIDQAVVIRDLGEVKKPDSKFIYLSGFSALHEETGKRIAMLNGAVNPYKFWTKHYIQAAGRGLGELAARTGLQFDSPHSQNFLIELDLNMKPTGRLILRDMADLYIDKHFFLALQGKDSPILKEFTQRGNILGHLAAGLGPLHGNVFPSWISPQQYNSWTRDFFTEFEKTFKEISGHDLKVLSNKKYKNELYFSASYRLSKNKHFNSLFKQLNEKGYVSNEQSKINMCSSLLSGAVL